MRKGVGDSWSGADKKKKKKEEGEKDFYKGAKKFITTPLIN